MPDARSPTGGGPPSPAGAGRSAILAAAALAALATAPTWQALALGQTFWFRDLILFYLPQKELAAAILRAGHLPTWDPFLHGGSALWANPNDGITHPATLLYVLLPSGLALGLETALHLAAAALGTFGLARRLGASTPGAFLAGGAFALSGVVLSLVCLHHLFLALTLLPAIAWAWEAWLSGPSPRPLAALSLLAALAIASGGAEAGLCSAITLGAWALARPGGRRLAARVAALAGCTALALLVAAPAWVPALEILRAAPRGAGFPWEHATAWSVHPARLPELVVPALLGDATALDPQAWWGAALEGESQPYLLSLFIGPAVAALALVGAACGALPRGLRRALGALTALALVSALGRHLPGVAALGGEGLTFPLRYPVKLTMLGALPVALLAGAGLDALGCDRARRVVAGGLAALTAALVALAAAATFPAPSSALAIAWLGTEPPSGALARALAAGAVHAAVALAALALPALARPDGREAARRWALALAACASLLVAGLPVNPATPRQRLEGEPPLVAPVRAAVGAGRLFRHQVETRRIARTDGDGGWDAWWTLATLQTYMAARYGIPVALHVDPDGLAPERIAQLRQGLPSLQWPQRLPLLASAGVTAVLSDEPLAVEGLREIAPLSASPDPALHLYQLERSADTLRFVPRVRLVADETSAVRAVTDPAHDPRHEVVLVGAGTPPDVPGCTGTVAPAALAPAPGQDAVVDAGCDGFLVLSLPHQPGLRARVDGAPAALIPADVGWCAVRVPRGRHVVSWEHRIASLPAAGAASLAGAVAVLALAMRGRRPRGSHDMLSARGGGTATGMTP